MSLAAIIAIDQHLSPLGQDVFRLCFAALAGGLVGLEREARGRQAGFRTNLLVCLGSALVMLVSTHFADFPWHGAAGVNINVDPGRIAYGVMTGVGFLGAGTILHHTGAGAVRGLTTAAGLWCVAAVGLAIGFGLYTLATTATVMIVTALWFLDDLERLIPREQRRQITIRTQFKPGCVRELVEIMKDVGVRVMETSLKRCSDLTHADVTIAFAFKRPEQFEGIIAMLETDNRRQVMAARDV
jgi:putative Mg2+ transporter-C (MgtC) family protein